MTLSFKCPPPPSPLYCTMFSLSWPSLYMPLPSCITSFTIFGGGGDVIWISLFFSNCTHIILIFTFPSMISYTRKRYIKNLFSILGLIGIGKRMSVKKIILLGLHQVSLVLYLYIPLHCRTCQRPFQIM